MAQNYSSTEGHLCPFKTYTIVAPSVGDSKVELYPARPLGDDYQHFMDKQYNKGTVDYLFDYIAGYHLTLYVQYIEWLSQRGPQAI